MIESLLGLPYKIKVLLDRLTPDRAAKLDNVNDTITSRAPASSAVSNAVLTDARIALLDYLANIATEPDRLKSRTHHQVSVTGTGAVIAFLDTPDVSAAKIRVIFLGCWCPSGGTCSGGVYYNGANITCQGNTASSGMTWSFILEEYW